MPWYGGESVVEILESVYVGGDRNLVDLRLPVQSVIRGADGASGPWPDRSRRAWSARATN